MNTTIEISLPQEQLDLLHQVKALVQKQVNFQIGGAWLTEKEAAMRLKVREADIRTWRLEGWLRHFKVGEDFTYRTDYLDEDFEQHALIPVIPGAALNHLPKAVEARQLSYLEAATSGGKKFVWDETEKRIHTTGVGSARGRMNARKASSEIANSRKTA